MGQFKRTLFASSYFGRAYAFTGEYRTKVIDAGKPFVGSVDIKIKATIPEMTYVATGDGWSYEKADWTESTSKKSITSRKMGASATFFACGDIFRILFQKSASGGVVTVSIKGDTGVAETKTIDTSLVDKYEIETGYENKWITVTTTSATPITILSAKARVATIASNIYASLAYQSGASGLKTKKAVTFPDGLKPDASGYIVGKSEAFTTNVQYVSAELFLATSETSPASSPQIDTLIFSSGDISEHSDSGNWMCALNMHTIAADSSVSFKKTKRVTMTNPTEATRLETENPNWWDQYFAVRSTSKANASSDKSIPSDTNVKNPSYWKPETATYRLYKGLPAKRISLGQEGNGSFVDTKTTGSILYGPYSVTTMGYVNTVITGWKKFIQTSAYPTQSSGTGLSVQFWDTKEITKYLPVYEYELREEDNPRSMLLSLGEQYPELYIRFVWTSQSGRQSPVLDAFSVETTLHFKKTLQYPNNKVSGLDNLDLKDLPKAQMGTKRLQSIAKTGFSLPAKAKNPITTLEYTPKYPNQGVVYIGDTTGVSISNTGKTNTPDTLYVYSKVTPEEPSASTQAVSKDRIYWHYLYDGGSIQYPRVTKREVGTDFTPDLTKDKKYRLQLISWWKDETFRLPKNMTWLEVEEILGVSVKRLKEKNPNILLYGDKIGEGTNLILPNDTKNPNIEMSFSSTKNNLSELSLWNGSAANEFVEAKIPDGGTYEAVDWTSEERFFVGILNPNNEEKSYLRTQSLAQSSSGINSNRTVTNTNATALPYSQIATEQKVSLDDLLFVNNLLSYRKEPNLLFVQPGESYIVPGTPSLPEIPPEVWYDGENPYKVEVIPGTVRRTEDNLLLKDAIVTPGSDDEQAVSYTLRNSLQKNEKLTRGAVANGGESIPYSNVTSVSRIVNDTNGTVYVPYVKSGTSEMGDYVLRANRIDWSPRHAGAKEPKAGETYTVTFTHGVVSQLRILYTSSYKEKAAFDKLWRSKEVKMIETIVGPNEEKLLSLPAASSYSDYFSGLKNISYVVEDNDLWVQSSVVDTEDGKKLLLTMNGKDPKRNWHPTIETGFYYLNNQEYYLYSEPMEHVFGKEDIPIMERVSYGDYGLELKTK